MTTAQPTGPSQGGSDTPADERHVAYEVCDGIATVTLDRPAALNAFTGPMCEQLIAAFDAADADDAVRAVVVTGRGRAFCAGADLSRGGATFDADDGATGTGDRAVPPRDGGGLVTLRIFSSLKPVIAAINGPAVGVGVTMTLPMDIRLASTTARLGFVFNRRGIMPEAASSWFLPRVVGISRALEWSMSGRLVPASEALEGGLVRSLHEPDELLPAAYALAHEITDETAAVSVALTRQVMWRMLGAPHPMAAHEVDSRGIHSRGRSADAREGIESFLQKRPARFPLTVSADMPGFFPWWEEPTFS